MGAWGSTLYANDTTLDVRDGYMDYLKDQLSNEDAYKKILEDFSDLIGDEDEEPLFWFALAETQWKVGRMTEEVKEKALHWIEKEGGVNLWLESGANPEGWKRTLTKLKEKLNSPMRSEKKIKKPEVIEQNLWNIGDVYAYQFHTEESKELGRFGKYVLLQKMGELLREPPWYKEPRTFMIIHIFNKLFDNLPTIEDVEGLRLLPVSATTTGDILMSRHMEAEKKKDYPEEHLSYLGNTSAPTNKRVQKSGLSVFWREVEGYLNNSFNRYQDKEIEEIEEGIFKFKDS